MSRSAWRTIAAWALTLWVALLPIQTRIFLHRSTLGGGPWEYGTLSLYLTDVLLAIAFMGVVFGDPDSWWRVPKKLPGVVLSAVVAVLLAAAVSVFQAFDIGVALGALVRLFVGFVAWWLILKTRVSLTTLALAIVVSASFEGLIALAQFASQSVLANTWFGMAAHAPSVAGDAVVETSLGRFLRAYATLPYPNVAGGWFVLGALFASALHLRSREKLERALLLGALTVILTGLVVTFSRSAFLSWVVVLFVLLGLVLQHERQPRRWPWNRALFRADQFLGLKMMKLVVVNILLFGALLYILAPLTNVRSEAMGRLERLSIDQRIEQFDEAQELLADHWLFGVGIGNYTKALHDEVDRKREWWGYQPVHNVYVLQLTELGVFGALLVLWWILVVTLTTLKEHLQRWHEHQEIPPWVVFGSLGLLALFFLGLLDHYVWSIPFGVMMFWLVFGMWAKSLDEP